MMFPMDSLRTKQLRRIDMGGIFDGTGSGKNRSPRVRFRSQKSLIMAGLSVLFLLAGCEQKEPGQEKDLQAEPLIEGKLPEETPFAQQPASENAGGGAGQEKVVLKDVQYYEKQSEASNPIMIQFQFSDGDSAERRLDETFGEVSSIYVDYEDLTGDGIEEVVVHRSAAAAAERYSVLDIFQVEGKEIRQIFPVDYIEGLEGNICSGDIFMVDRNGREGNGLHLKVCREAGESGRIGENILQVAEEMDLFYEDGRWVRLPERELRVEVSLGSDSPEAEIYEAFLRGECEAALSGQYYSGISYLDPVPAGQESFRFQEMLDMIVSGIRENLSVDGMERVECSLIDCGGDGRPELAVRAYGVSIYSPHDNSSVIMIFRCRDGKVELIYSVDCWARSYTDIYPDGHVAGRGSGGALTHYASDGIIGADGAYREYSLYIETEQPLYGMTGYKAVGEERLPAEFCECTLGDEKIYGYYILEDITEDVRENVMAYIAENEEKMGVKFMPNEEMYRKLDSWADSLGITEEMRERVLGEAEGISWQTVGGCGDYLYGQQ